MIIDLTEVVVQMCGQMDQKEHCGHLFFPQNGKRISGFKIFCLQSGERIADDSRCLTNLFQQDGPRNIYIGELPIPVSDITGMT